MSNIKYVVLDTNIYLHYKDIEHIDWCKLLHADAVEIIVPLIVLNEIDKHKDSHPVAKIKKRARAVSKKLYEYFFNSDNEKAVIKDNITISSCDPDVKPHDYGFEANRQDQYLIASILKLKEELYQDIILIAADNGALLLAKKKGIKAMRMPDEFRLSDEKTKEEKENEKLKKELMSIKNAMPNMKISINGNSESPIILNTNSFELPETKTLDEIKLKYTPIEEPVNKPFSILIKGTNYYEDKNKERLKYIKKYEKHLEVLEFYKNIQFVILEIEIVNEGGAPANDVDIYLQFPADINITEYKKLIKILKTVPKPPNNPNTFGELLGNNWMKQQALNMPEINNLWDSCELNEDNNILSIHIKKLKHGDKSNFTDYALIFRFDALFNFKLKYELRVANIPKIRKGELNCVVNEIG